MPYSVRRRIGWVGVLGLLMAMSVACDFGHSMPTVPDQSNVPYSVVDLTVGTGTVAASGHTVNVTFSEWLYSDTATDHKGTQLQGGTFAFALGAGQVIQGFDMAVTGMAVGGSRRAIVPPSLAYGSTGDNTGTIPPNAALVFEIQLNTVQ
jgi:FKBP-type peptidyl-prolyl cis-trans isomerase FkpA